MRSDQRETRGSHGQHIIGQRKLFAGSGIERDQHDESGPQGGQVRFGFVVHQPADEAVAVHTRDLDPDLALSANGFRLVIDDRAHGTHPDGEPV